MFNEFPDQKIVDQLRKIYPSGTRVVLEKMEDPLSRIRDKGSYLEK